MQTEMMEGTAVQEEFAGARGELRLKNILVPTDFTESSIKALDYGMALAQQFDAVLWLVHIVEPSPAFSGLEGVPITVAEPEEEVNYEGLMAEFAAKHIPPGVAVTSLVRHGSAVAEISDLARTRNIDLVVISTHARKGLDRALFGGMAERILHHAPCPILVVRQDEHEFLRSGPDPEGPMTIQLNRILAPVDFSECSKKAVQYAQAFARTFDAEILCVHVLPHEKPMIIFETEGYRKRAELESRKKMEAQLAMMDPAIRLESEIVSGPAHGEIVALAGKREVDMIILGEHCHSETKRHILGTTTDHVIRHAHCPVLVVREFEREFVET
jgi:nucleotide-binding universal stress UspA family protein